MANDLTDIAEDLKFFGNILIPRFENALVLVPKINTSYSGAATAPGSKVEIPSFSIAGAARTRVSGGAVTRDDVSGAQTEVTVQEVYKYVEIDNLDTTFSNVDILTRAAADMAYVLAAGCDSIVAALYNEIGGQVGEVDGSAAFNSTDDIDVLADARKLLMDFQTPMESQRLHAVLHPAEATALRKLASFKNQYQAGSSIGRNTGELGSLQGFNLWESQQINTATLSVNAETLTPGAVVGAHSKGATSLSVNAIGAGTVKKGTSFTIAGIDNVNAALYRFAVTADATITGNAATLSIWPPLPEALAGSEAITFREVTNPPASMNLVFHENAIVGVARNHKPFREGGGVVSVIVRSPATGLGIRISYQAHLATASGSIEALKADLLFGAKVVIPGWACVITGTD